MELKDVLFIEILNPQIYSFLPRKSQSCVILVWLPGLLHLQSLSFVRLSREHLATWLLSISNMGKYLIRPMCMLLVWSYWN
uniref:Uncharacterized protein n=1 Tax=Salix viminalis TaxID=40686 RepID=A0A6N2LV49_SALVM